MKEDTAQKKKLSAGDDAGARWANSMAIRIPYLSPASIVAMALLGAVAQLGWCCARHDYWTIALHKVVILLL